MAKPTASTYEFQDDLKSLPLPSLSSTCSKLLKVARPLLDDAEFANTTALVEDFLKKDGVGEKMHAILQEQQKTHRNWLELYWEDYCYLTQRYPTAIWVNIYAPYFCNSAIPGSTSQAHAAAIFLHLCLLYRKMAFDETLPVEYSRKDPLCMNQYNEMFNTRIPGQARDTLVKSVNSRHAVVFYRDHLYAMDITDIHQNPFAVSKLTASLQVIQDTVDAAIQKQTGAPQFAHGMVGLLTAHGRTEWAVARDQLLRLDPKNLQTLSLIESAICTVTLETTYIGNRAELTHELLHGNGCNRWFDKSFQVIATRNRRVGVNAEHSPADAMVWVEMSKFARSHLKEHPEIAKLNKETMEEHERPVELFWVLNDTLQQEIVKAKAGFDALASQLDVEIYKFKDFGKNKISREYKTPPDGFVQLAMQLASYRLYGRSVNTYETGHLRAFYHGRTETVRPCSSETDEWVKAMNNPTVSIAQRVQLAQKALLSWKTYLVDAMSGKGIDRHLLALRVQCQRQTGSLHPIFTSKALQEMGQYRLSTSNIGSHKCSMYGGFSPACEDGIAACYTIQDSNIVWSIVTFKTAAPQITPRGFALELQRACFELAELLEARAQSKL